MEMTQRINARVLYFPYIRHPLLDPVTVNLAVAGVDTERQSLLGCYLREQLRKLHLFRLIGAAQIAF